MLQKVDIFIFLAEMGGDATFPAPRIFLFSAIGDVRARVPNSTCDATGFAFLDPKLRPSTMAIPSSPRHFEPMSPSHAENMVISPPVKRKNDAPVGEYL